MALFSWMGKNLASKTSAGKQVQKPAANWLWESHKPLLSAPGIFFSRTQSQNQQCWPKSFCKFKSAYFGKQGVLKCMNMKFLRQKKSQTIALCTPSAEKSSFWKVPIVNADFAKHKFRFFLSLVLVLKLLFCALLSQIWQCRVLHTLSKTFCMENLAVLSDPAHHYDHHHSRHHHHHHDGHFDHHHQKWGTPRSTCITKIEK